MIAALRAKFKKQTPCAASMQALAASGSEIFFIEHTSNDSTWGDGGTGNGTSLFLSLFRLAPPSSPFKKQNRD